MGGFRENLISLLVLIRIWAIEVCAAQKGFVFQSFRSYKG